MTCMFVGVAPKASVKKITTRLFTNKMTIFITKEKVKYMIQNSLPGTFPTEIRWKFTKYSSSSRANCRPASPT